MDQSGLAYEIPNLRTLSPTGSRNVILNIDSKNEATHSYTIQAIVSRAGKPIGKLLICLKEDKNSFGPRIAPRVEELEALYGNVRVICSKSGKMTADLLQIWADDVLMPAVADHLQPFDSEEEDDDEGDVVLDYEPHNPNEPDDRASEERESRLRYEDCWHYRVHHRIQAGAGLIGGAPWDGGMDMTGLRTHARRIECTEEGQQEGRLCRRRPSVLLLADEWLQNKENITDSQAQQPPQRGTKFVQVVNNMRKGGVKILTIPKHSTDKLQPLDVAFFRQYKILIKRIMERAYLNDEPSRVTSRDGVINMNSLVWNQMNAPVYWDLIRTGWRHADNSYVPSELTFGEPPTNVLTNQQHPPLD